MTTATQALTGRAAPPSVGAPFARSLLQALAVGVVPVLGFLLVRGPASGWSALLGLAIAGFAFGATLLLMLAPLRRAHPSLMLVAALTLYAVQMVALLYVYDKSQVLNWLDGVAVGSAIFVVAVAWQVAQIRAWRRSRTPVFDHDAATIVRTENRRG